MKNIFKAGTLLLFFSLMYSQSNAQKTNEFTSKERISFISGSDTLVGYLSKPEKKDSFPLVVVLHSANSGVHDKPIYNHLNETLNKIGVGVFVYDRRGSGESKGNFATASFEDLARDAINAIKYLKRRQDIIKTKIGLYGVSQGGWIAPVASKLDKDDISFLILVSSCGVTPAEQMDYTTLTDLKRNNFGADDITRSLQLRKDINRYYRGQESYANVQKEIDKFKNEKWISHSWLPLEPNYTLPRKPKQAKWFQEMDFSPATYFSSIKIPICLFYGATDIWVPIEPSINVWKKALAESKNKNFDIYRIRRSGHLMILDEDENPKEKVFSNEYASLMCEWVKKILKL